MHRAEDERIAQTCGRRATPSGEGPGKNLPLRETAGPRAASCFLFRAAASAACAAPTRPPKTNRATASAEAARSRRSGLPPLLPACSGLQAVRAVRCANAGGWHQLMPRPFKYAAVKAFGQAVKEGSALVGLLKGLEQEELSLSSIEHALAALVR